jgi:hypothetical protein
VDPTRRKILTTGAAATAIAARQRVFAQEAAPGTGARFYEKGSVRIAYQEAGSGFPLLLIAGGGLNSTLAGLATMPFNPVEEFKGEYRCVFADLRNANRGESAGPLEIDRPWDSFADDPSRADGSPRNRQVHGPRILHRWSIHLEPSEAGS